MGLSPGIVAVGRLGASPKYKTRQKTKRAHCFSMAERYKWGDSLSLLEEKKNRKTDKRPQKKEKENRVSGSGPCSLFPSLLG